MMIGLFRALRERISRSLEMNKYNRFTIAEYFRKQGAQVGEGCSFIVKSLGDEPWLVKIGNHVAVADGVTFGTHDGGCWVLRQENPNLQAYGPIIIEDNCVIGQNALIFLNVRIGADSIVGAGSVVIADVPPGRIVMGNPARVIGSVEKYKEKCLVRWAQQCPSDVVIEEGRTWWTSRHYPENRIKLRRHLTKLFWEDGYREKIEGTPKPEGPA